MFQINIVRSFWKSTFGLKLSKFLRAASSIVKYNVRKRINLHASSSLKSITIITGQAWSSFIGSFTKRTFSRGNLAGSAVKSITLEAASAFSISIGVGVAIGWNTYAFSFTKNPEFSAGKAGLSIPVPISASRIRWRITCWEGTASACEFIAFIAGQTVSISIIISLTESRDRNTNVIIEIPEFRAGQANLGIPIPFGASCINGWLWVQRWEDARSIVEDITIEATGAGKPFTGFTEIRNSNTDSLIIERPVLRALFADSLGPSFASRVARGSGVGAGINASTFEKIVTWVASDAISWKSIEWSA